MKKSNNPSSIRSKKWIINSLLKLMHQKPYNQISIKEIMENADLSRQTFYLNFNSKDEVLNTYLEQLVKESFSIMPEEKFNYTHKDLFSTPFHYWDKHSNIIELLLKNHIVFALHDIFIKTLAEHAKEKIPNLIEGPDYKLRYFIEFLAGAFLNVIILWINDGKIIPVEELADMLFNLSQDYHALKNQGNGMHKDPSICGKKAKTR